MIRKKRKYTCRQQPTQPPGKFHAEPPVIRYAAPVREYRIKCTHCGKADSRVTIVRDRMVGGIRRIDRWRTCNSCGWKFRSYELPEDTAK